MQLVTSQAVLSYSTDDSVMRWLDKYSEAEDEQLTCQRWLRESVPKRFIFQQLYGDLIARQTPMRILDVGGGLTCMTRVFVKHHNYCLIDLSAHDRPQLAQQFNDRHGQEFIITKDWYDCDLQAFDLVIVNDLFPNVDQRLELFLDKCLSKSAELRLSLTWYNKPRFYHARALDRAEIFALLAWNGDQLHRCLARRRSTIKNPDFTIFDTKEPSVFPNGRHVCVIEFSGHLNAK